MKLLVKPLCIVFCSFLFSTSVYAVNPIGVLDRADATIIYGWAKDDDFTGSISVHIYVDGQFVKQLIANDYRSDVGGNFGFSWQNPPAFGPGSHEVRAYAIGVNSTGQADGETIELTGSPKISVQPLEFVLNSNDGKVSVVLNSKFGGAVTKIYDNENLPGKNLINDSQAGAMFQSAFWLSPRHSVLPPRCAEVGHTGEDAWWDNPTQAGYFANPTTGNPIGELGYLSGQKDPLEFIRWENNNKTVHFKTRFIRYDYCLRSMTLMDIRDLWDTNFYIEQWAYFSDVYANTFVIKSKLTYDGAGSREVRMGGGLQVIYGIYLPRVAYKSNGVIVIQNGIVGVEGPVQPIPDNNWMAMINDQVDAGVGMVFAPSGRSDVDPSRFNFAIRGISGYPDLATDILSSLGGGAVWQTVGRMINVLDRTEPHPDVGTPMHHYTMDNTSSFEWYMYFPVGQLSQINQNAENILQNEDFGFIDPTPNPTPTPIPTPTPTPPPAFSINDLKGLLTNYVGLLESGYDIYPIDEKINMLDMGYVAKYQIN